MEKLKKNQALIKEILNGTDGHMTAEEIYNEAKARGKRISLATVYNNLNSLCEEGAIKKVSVEGCPDRYDKIKKHDHLVCSRCKALSDITFSDLTASLSEQLGEPILSYDLKVNYLCPNCRKLKQ